jgi:hypothetical protein
VIRFVGAPSFPHNQRTMLFPGLIRRIDRRRGVVLVATDELRFRSDARSTIADRPRVVLLD